MLLLGSINERDLLVEAGQVLGDQFLFPSPIIQLAVDDISLITDPKARAAAEAFLTPLKAKYGDKVDSSQASRAWDSLLMMVQAMEAAKTTEGTAVRDAFEKLGPYVGAGAPYDFSAEQHVGITKNPYVMAYVKRTASWPSNMTADSQPTPALIEVNGLSASYGHVAALKPVDLRVAEGEFVTVLGPNGAGKTTLLRAMSRLIASNGQIRFKGQDITALPTHHLAELGIIMVQEGRGLFGEMTVHENLLLGAYGLGGRSDEVERRFEQVFRLFPRLRERTDQIAASMSGGEQQMLAVGRALMAGPKLLMLDEPSLGLAPKVAAGILETLGRTQPQRPRHPARRAEGAARAQAGAARLRSFLGQRPGGIAGARDQVAS